jgi:chaperonin GroEL (HSP60 family)
LSTIDSIENVRKRRTALSLDSILRDKEKKKQKEGERLQAFKSIEQIDEEYDSDSPIQMKKGPQQKEDPNVLVYTCISSHDKVSEAGHHYHQAHGYRL